MTVYGPPTPIHLDGVAFFNDRQEHEFAYCFGGVLGEIDQDDNNNWQARKLLRGGEMSSWKPMRCAAEARAFIVSNIRQ